MHRLDGLPDRVRSTARVDPNGEVAWRREDAEAAIVALGAAGCLVLGLDFRRYADDGGIFEVAWSAHDPQGRSSEDVNIATEQTLVALRRGLAQEDLMDVPWVLITWTE